eukprot:5258583-Prymnesium_polylepis.1
MNQTIKQSRNREGHLVGREGWFGRGIVSSEQLTVPSNQTIRQSDNPTIRQSDNPDKQTLRQADTQTSKQSGEGTVLSEQMTVVHPS